jgi:hypothetical protein
MLIAIHPFRGGKTLETKKIEVGSKIKLGLGILRTDLSEA